MKTKIFITLLMLAAGFLNVFAQDEPAKTMAPTFYVISSDTDRMTMSIECSDADATIYYTLDGSIPTHSSTEYSGFLKITRNLTIKAIAWTAAGGDSDLSVYNVEYLETPMPEFSYDLNYVSITNRLEGTTTRYTLDETDPRTSATAITYDGNPVLLTGDCTIMAYSSKEGLKNSQISVGTFYFTRTQVPYISIEANFVSMECQDAGATIYYTLDGTTPTHDSNIYNGRFKIEHNANVKAMAWTEWGGDSEVSTYEVTWFVTPLPEFSQELNSVRITNSMEGTTTRYTLDESDPKTSATAITYDGNPIRLTHDCTILAYSFKEGLNDSGINTLLFSFTHTQEPYINIAAGLVSMECPDAGATIYYTLDGSTPTHDSNLYTSPFKIEHNVTVKAIAWTEWGGDSEVSTTEVSEFCVPMPEFSQELNSVRITNSMEGTTTRYTLDESDPKTSATAITYDGNPIRLTKDCTIMAYSFKEGLNDSAVNIWYFYFTRTQMPNINFESDIVSLECQDAEATIYYTLDGSIPSHDSNVYTTPFKIGHNVTVKAMAWTEWGGDSEVNTYEVNLFETPMPEFTQEFNSIRITNSMEGTTTRYTLDESDPKTSATAITYDGNPIRLTKDCTIMAYSFKEGLNDSGVNIWNFYFTRTQMPNIGTEANFVTIDCPDAGATIYYTIDGSTPSHDSNIYSSPFKTEQNLTVKAMAWTEWGGDSEVSTYGVNWFYVPAPELEQVGDNKYIFTNSMEGAATKYTLDGSNPKTNPSAIVFDGNPFGITQDVTVYAYSYKENFTDSPVVEFSLTAKCAAPVVSDYDGHIVTLSCPEPGATIHYYDNYSGKLKKYTEPFALHSINPFEFYAVVEGSGISESDRVYYEPEYFSDSESVQLRKPGLAAKAMEWQPDNNSANLKVVTYDENWAPFALDNSDFGYIRGKAGLKHLDLTETANTTLPDGAFQNMQLISLILPSTLTDYGKNTLSGCNSLSSVTFLANSPLPANLLDSKTPNPNMMLFVEKKANADLLPAGSCNVLAKYGSGYRADNVSLTHGYPFYYNQIFHAVAISYSRDFNKTTPLGGCAGWEGICIPFDVESIRFGEKELKPFGYWSDDDTLNFWLYSYEQNIWSQSSYIFANRAYLISMPNNENYLEGYSISGTVTFSASNKDLYPNDYDPNGNSQLKANYAEMEASDDVMTLNDYSYMADGNLYEPGSVFVAGERGAKPFEAYILNENGARYMKVFDGASVDEMPAAQGFNVWTEGNELCIVSSIDARVRIFDTTGRLVRIAEVRHGETCRVQGLTAGIYIAGNRKIYVRK